MSDTAKTEFFLPKAEFEKIYARVPRLTVEVVVPTPDGVVLAKRSMEPCIGQWHIPGGTVFFEESLEAAVRRVAKAELGVDVEVRQLLGYIEYPEMHAAGYFGWPIGIAFEVAITSGKLRGSDQGEELGYFKQVPPGTITEQDRFLTRYFAEKN